MIEKTNGGFLIGKIKQIQARVFERLLSEHGIDQFNGAQGRILFVLWDGDNIPISELSKNTGLAKTTLTSMLDRLEQSGLVRRVFDPSDRRKVNITLTEETRKLKEHYHTVSLHMNEIFYKGFTDAEVLGFENALMRILTNLEAKEDENE